MKKLLIALGILGFIGTAHAVSVFNSGQVGSNPINGYYLQTNGSTSTWAAGGGSVTSTYIGYGSGTNTLTGSSSFNFNSVTGLVQAQLINGEAYAGDFPGGDMGAQIANAYAALPASGGTIHIPVDSGGACWPVTTALTFNTKGKLVKLDGAGGGGFYDNSGACLQWTPSSGTMFTVDTNNYVSAGSGLFNVSLVGPAGSGNIGSSVVTSTYAVSLGGTDTNGGAFGFQLSGVNISSFGTGLYVGSNVSFLDVNHSTIQKNGQNIYFPQVSGANGENDRFSYDVIADSNSASGGSIAAYCVQIQLSGNVQITFDHTSFDDCQLYTNQYGGTANIIKSDHNHFEDPNTGIGAYDFISGISGQASSTVITSESDDFMQDMNTGLPAEYVLNGGWFLSTDDTVELSGGQSNTAVGKFVTNQDANDVFSWKGLTNNFGNTSASGAFTYVFGTQTYTTTLSSGLGYGINTLITSSGGVATSSFSNNYISMASGGSTITNSNIYQNAGTSYATIAFVQSTSTQAGCTNCTQEQTSTLSGVGSGNLLFIALDVSQIVAPTLTDTNGTPVFIASTTWHGASAVNYIYYEANVAAGTHTVHVHYPGFQSYPGLLVAEYSGVSTSSALDSFATNTGSGGSTISSGNFSASSLPNELIIGYGNSAGGTITASTGFTLRDSNAGATEDNLPSSLAQGTVTSSTFNYNAGPTWVVQGALFKPYAIAGNNYIGIGTTTPSTALDVNGDITDENVKSAPCTGTNSSGTFISATCLAANQKITLTLSGDATGTASGTTSLADAITVTGIQGVAVTSSAPTVGDIWQYTALGWIHNPTSTVFAGLSTTATTTPFTTGNIATVSSSGAFATFIGSNCTAGSVMTGTSASGTAVCVTTSTILTNYSTSTGATPTTLVSSTAQAGTANTFMRSDGAPGLNQAAPFSFSALGNTTSTANIQSATLHTTGAMTVSSTFSAAGASTLLNYKSLTSLGTNASGTPLHLGTSTAVAIGGASLALDACTSTTSVVPFVLATSTAVFTTNPQIYLNPALFQWTTAITSIQTGSTTVTTYLCDSLAAGSTPTSTKFNFIISQISGM